MRKILMILLIIALVVFTGFVVYKGTSIGNFQVWGVKQISTKNDEIDSSNEKLGNLVNNTYPSTLTKLTTSSETLQETKKEYEDKALLLSQNRYYKYKEDYKHEFILVKIGNYAENNGVDIRLVVTESTVSGLYDLNFTLYGHYIDIANFIYDIENDSKLGYKIDNFIEVAATEAEMSDRNFTDVTHGCKANFYCKEISIDLKWLDENESVINGIITRGNPYSETLTKAYGGSGSTTTNSSTPIPETDGTPTAQATPTPVTGSTPTAQGTPTPTPVAGGSSTAQGTPTPSPTLTPTP